MRNDRPRARPVSGFTLIELLVVVAIITLLLAILLPSLSAARDEAKQTKCLANLSTLGKGFMTYAADNREYLSSGQSSHEIGINYPRQILDQEIIGLHKVGWIADQATRQVPVGDLLCPGNIAQHTEAFVEGGVNMATPYGGYPTRFEFLIANKINTNYCQSWYMAHTQAKPAPTIYDRKYAYPTLSLTRGDLGPLRTNSMDRAQPARVPLLADARQDFDEDTIPGISNSLLVAERVSDGPTWWLTSETFAIESDGYRYGLQDWQDMGPAHGSRGLFLAGRGHTSVEGNMLFGDGHAAALLDRFASGSLSSSPGAKVDGADGRFDLFDLEAKVFDGALTLGRRSDSNTSLQ